MDTKENPTTEQEVQEEPKQEQQKPESKSFMAKYGMWLIILLLILLLIVAAVIAYILLQEDDEDEAADDTNQEEMIDEEDAEVDEGVENPADEDGEDDPEDEEEEVVVPTAVDEDRVAYVKDNNIWYINNDGTGKTQVTNDGSDEIRYSGISWKEPGVFSYAKCDGSCAVYNYDITSAATTMLFEGIPFTQSFVDIEWSHDGTMLAHLFSKGDGSHEAAVWDGSSATTFHPYALIPGRGVGIDDGFRIEFSETDSMVLFWDSFVDSAFDKPIMVFEDDGTFVVELSTSAWPSFDGDDGVYFQNDGKLQRYDFGLGTASPIDVLQPTIPHGFVTSPDKTQVGMFYTQNLGDPVIDSKVYNLFLDVATESSLEGLGEGYGELEWLDDSAHVVAITSPGVIPGGGYDKAGIAKIHRTTEVVTSLDTGFINYFDIEQ